MNDLYILFISQILGRETFQYLRQETEINSLHNVTLDLEKDILCSFH